MSAQTILVIDDSATIRRMVDSHLSQEGYRVVLAPDGESGIEAAKEIGPDLILLDHQLPGTTGLQICRQIIADPECSHIPFVVSSTLRKQAYVEYMDVPNVVDSLPKPFKPDLLKMTVANALETGSMIVSSQANGTAVPEVVESTEQTALSGDFTCFGVREIIDFLNNGRQQGVLEIETKHDRLYFHLGDGRIQGVSSPSFDAESVAAQLPESIAELAPLLQFTMSTGTSTRVDGLVELMNNKVIDARLLRSLLRHQAAILTRFCFLSKPSAFSFHSGSSAPALFHKAAVDSCLAALLIDGAVSEMKDPHAAGNGEVRAWVRNSIRGQNLDRTGLAARHVQLLSLLSSTPVTSGDLADRSGLPLGEVEAVMEGFQLAEWVEASAAIQSRTLIAFEPNPQNSAVIRSVIEDPDSGWTGHVVRDDFSLQLLLKRKQPDALLVAVAGAEQLDVPDSVSRMRDAGVPPLLLILPVDNSDHALAPELSEQQTLASPFTANELRQTLEQLEPADGQAVVTQPSKSLSAPVPETAGAH